METIKEFLESDIYLDIIKKLGLDNFNDEEKSTIISIGKYAITSIAMYIIEFDILKNHSEILVDYYKRLCIPGAMKYAKEMKKIYKKAFD